MSTLKKLLALTLALAMVLSVSVFAGNYSADTYADADKIAEGCKDAVEVMYALDIMQGKGANTFDPNGTITRAEMAKIIYVILNDSKDATYWSFNCPLTDVPSTEWYAGYVNYCYLTGKVAGYGNGTFGPNDPLTVAQAAKMLLTAIGYDAKTYGFEGADWENNVITWATRVGLLQDVATDMRGQAPRQWVAKMVMNSLTAYCFDNVTSIPTNAILNGFWYGSGDVTNITTFGEKYLGLGGFTSVAMATKVTSLYKDDGKTGKKNDFQELSANGILFANGADLKGTGLTVEDLGQEFRVITKRGAVVSVRNTGVSQVSEILKRDLTAKTLKGTASNDYANKYEFTFGDMVATFEANAINGIKLGEYTDVVYAADYKAQALYTAAFNGKNEPTTIKAIDSDNNGKIDYIVETVYEYGAIEGAYTHRTYGDYVKVVGANGDFVSPKTAQKMWYLADVVNCAEDLEAGEFVKYNYNHETGVYDMETLPIFEAALDRIVRASATTPKTWVLNGEGYVYSEKAGNYGVPGGNVTLNTADVEDSFIVVADGDMLVNVSDPAEAPLTLDEVNAKLAVVLDKTNHYYDGWNYTNAVKLLTFDGEITAELKLADGQTYESINVVGDHAETPACSGSISGASFKTYLYVYSEKDGVVTLTPAMTAEGHKAMDKNKDVVDTYWGQDLGDKTWKVGTLLEGDTVVLENYFFVGTGTGNKFSVEVMTLEELKGLTASDVHFEALYTEKSTSSAAYNKYDFVGGYIAADSIKGSTSSVTGDGYLYLTGDTYYEDEAYWAPVYFADGSEDTIELSSDKIGSKDIVMYNLYAYDVVDGVYTLKNVSGAQNSVKMNVKNGNVVKSFDAANAAKKELVEGWMDDGIIYVDEDPTTDTNKATTLDLTDCVIAVKRVYIDKDYSDENVIEASYEIDFVTLDELMADESIFNGYELNDDTYYSDFCFKAENHMYITVYRVASDCQF